MRILICSDGKHAHYYQRQAWANAFDKAGHEVYFWNKNQFNAFDVFDQANPDIFLGQSYNLDQSTLKCIYERPHMRVALRAGDWGDHEEYVDKSQYNILFCSEQEKQILKKLKDETGKPDFVHIHYHEDSVGITHNHFEKIGIPAKSIMMCADTVVYG